MRYNFRFISTELNDWPTMQHAASVLRWLVENVHMDMRTVHVQDEESRYPEYVVLRGPKARRKVRYRLWQLCFPFIVRGRRENVPENLRLYIPTFSGFYFMLGVERAVICKQPFRNVYPAFLFGLEDIGNYQKLLNDIVKANADNVPHKVPNWRKMQDSRMELVWDYPNWVREHEKPRA